MPTVLRFSGSFVDDVRQREPIVHLLALAIFAAATALSAVAQHFERPVTSAMVYLLGVTLVGALEGLRGGLLAAILASAAFNFFLREPMYRFSLSTAEEYVPLIVFNLSAAASGLLAGRLRDRARAAEIATRRLNALFEVSGNLQRAVRLDEVPGAITSFAEEMGWARPQIYILDGADLVPIGEASQPQEMAKRLLAAKTAMIREGSAIAALLSTTAGPIGALLLEQPAGTRRAALADDLDAFLNVLSMAIERCLLLERLSEAELVKRSEEFKTALLSSVSHDMRTPLSAISASASSLASFSEELPEETRIDLLKMIQEQCDRLNRYTSNLLNLGRVQSGLNPEQLMECDALEVLGSAIGRVRMLGTGHQIIKDYEISSGLVRADPAMLEQTFFNVLENAVRYSPGGTSVRVRATSRADELKIAISDQGAGIPKRDLQRVFERFYRSKAALSQAGSGLGLSIAKGFTEAFGGSISAAPAVRPETGTVIIIRLPLAKSKVHA